MNSDNVPAETLRVFARSIYDEAGRYGFQTIDVIRLINELMDLATLGDLGVSASSTSSASDDGGALNVDSFPLSSERLTIRPADKRDDVELLKRWMLDEYGKHFVLSSASAQKTDVESLLANEQNRLGIIITDEQPIGAVAFLDIDESQKRAELRKLIGERDVRGKGFAEEATRLWVEYGFCRLGLEKIYVSTLQTHLRNIQLNESIGFRVEGLLREEVLIGHSRFDVLRMGLTRRA